MIDYKEVWKKLKESVRQYTGIMEDWIPKDASIAIAIGTQYIDYVPGKYDIRLKEGEPISPGSLAEKVIEQRSKVEQCMDDKLFGTPYYGIGYPIDVEGEPGALIIILPPTYRAPILETFSFLTGKQEEEWSPIPVEHITHIESLNKKTWFYAEGEQYHIGYTLKDLHPRLPNFFLRTHRSYIVNIQFIRRIARDFSSNLVLTLKDGTELPVSQKYMSDVRTVLGF
ncbi:histidine kinase [Sporosarcina sp. HYO08]|nr:histidine kinase [Sporosarcina sp. HYO08]